jgi:S-adenosyl-L-methionine hydrolase (adenosine-forming)
VDALHDAPDFGIEPSAHLLGALAPEYPRGSVFLAIVDPGVGGERDAIVVKVDGRTFVGPDNGLLSILWQRARRTKCLRIAWRPRRLSGSFHGRDLFAPVAAALATRRVPRGWLAAKPRPDVLLDARDLTQVIYVDHFDNCVTGIRAKTLSRTTALRAGARVVRYARTFEQARGAFWYKNSLGLAEISIPRGRAARTLGLRVGYAIRIAR